MFTQIFVHLLTPRQAIRKRFLVDAGKSFLQSHQKK